MEGTGEGFDVKLTKKIAASVPVPVIAAGGCGQLSHAKDVVEDGMADAISLASILHYHALDEKKLHYRESDFKQEGNIEFVKSKRSFSKVSSSSIKSIKKFLMKENINCRL
jgi:cyclase